MQLSLTDWSVIFSFLLISLIIGLLYKGKAGKSLTDFFLSGRNLPWYIAGVSMVATTFAADTPLAVTELVAKNGISGNWLWWNFLAGGMITTFFFSRLWRRAGVLTELEFIEMRYSGIGAAILRGFKSVYLGMIINVLIIGWVNLAMATILEVFFGLSHLHALLWTAGLMLLAAGYSTISGLWGVAVTDFVQFILAMTGCIILAILVLNSEKVGGMDALKSSLPPGTLDFFPSISSSVGLIQTGKALSIGIGALLAYVGVQWWASWYPGAEPGGGGYIAQRMMSAKDEKHSFFATLFFQVAHYCLRPWPWIIVGLCSLVLYPDLAVENQKMGFVMAMKDFLPNGLRGLLLAAFLAAYMSTISTQLNWGASYLVNDLYKRFLRPESSFPSAHSAQKKYVFVSRLFTLLLMLISIVVTSYINSISGVWSFIIECGAGLGLVLILRWYWWRINAWSELAATIAPVAGYAIARYYLLMEFPDSFFVTVVFTTIVWLVVTFLTPPSEKNALISFYSKVYPGGWWGPFKNDKQKTQSSMTLLWFCCLLSIIFTYSLLFLTGKILFKMLTDAGMWFAIAAVSLILLLIGMKRMRFKSVLE